MGGLDVLGEFLLEGGDLAGVQLVEVTAHTTVDDGDLPMYSQLTTVLIQSASDQPTLIYCNVNLYIGKWFSSHKYLLKKSSLTLSRNIFIFPD